MQALSESNLEEIVSRLRRGIGVTNEKLDHILVRIEETETQVGVVSAAEIERTVRELVDDLNALEVPVAELFEDVDTLKFHRHSEANDFHKQYVHF